MSAHPKKYHAFLLRLWQIENEDENIWRVSLEDSRTGEKHGFASLEAAWQYLKEILKNEQRNRYKTTED